MPRSNAPARDADRRAGRDSNGNGNGNGNGKRKVLMTESRTHTTLEELVPASDSSDTVRSLYRALNGSGVRVVGRGARVVGSDATDRNGAPQTNGTLDTHDANGANGGSSLNGAADARSAPGTAGPSAETDVQTRRRRGARHRHARSGAMTAPVVRPARRSAYRDEVRFEDTRPSRSRRQRVHLRQARRTVPVPTSTTPRRARAARLSVSWRQALCAGLVCFAVWLVLDAPTLLRSAEAGPLGARRTVAISVLRPIDDLSRWLGVSHVVSGADRAMGRDNTGVLQQEGPPVRRRQAGRHPVAGGAPERTRFVFTPLTTPDGLRPLVPPTAASPLQVLAVGDSLGIDFGQSLVNDLAATGVVHAVLDGHIDTGLSRPDYFDWQGELQADLARYQPQAVVVFIGANDPQIFVDGQGAVAYGTQAWDEAYAKRVGDFMQAATTAGARVLWVGMPPMADPVLNAKMQTLNGIYQAEANAHRGVTYFASWPVLSDAQGAYSAFLSDASGNAVEVREPDGTHISPPGAERLSRAAIATLDHAWGLSL